MAPSVISNRVYTTKETHRMQKRKIRWVIAHLPEHLFIRTANAFSKALDEILPGQFEVEILRAGEYAEKYNKYQDIGELQDLSADSSTAMDSFFQALEHADIEMGQFQLAELADRFSEQMNVFDMPYMFDNHEHVNRVVEGDIGAELQAGIEMNSPVKPLAYTYSGGYRTFGSHRPLETLADIKKVATSKGVLADTLRTALGSDTTEQGSYLSTKADLPNDDIPVVESTYLRFNDRVKHIYKTDHSMFMTDIVVSKKFFNTLNEEQQQGMMEAAKQAAKQERQWSIDDAESFENNSEAHGRKITAITDAEQAMFRKTAQRMYVKYRHMFKDNIINRIKRLS